MYKHILTAVSLDKGHYEVVHKAVELTKAFNAQVSFLHVVVHNFVSPAWAPAVGGYGFSERVSEAEMRKKVDDAGADLKRLATECGVDEANIDVWIATSVKAAVQQVAVKEKSDLIVIGSHVRRGKERLLVNSHGYQVVRTAPCDVLVIDLTE